MDPRVDALARLDALLSRASRAAPDAADAQAMVDLLRFAPGRSRRVAETLAASRSSGAVDALLQLPASIPGVVEGLHQAFSHGVTRTRRDGSPGSPLLALEFVHSRARRFPEYLERAQTAFGGALRRFRVDGRVHYRFALEPAPGTLAGRVAVVAHDLTWLHRQLAKLKGSRLWINGWPFDADGPFGASVQVHLLRAWLTWAGQQTATVARPPPRV